jgi:DNA-binding CsgD family transcriptional regulator
MSYAGSRPFDAVLSEEIDRIAEFRPRAVPLSSRFGLLQRTEELGAWNRPSLWREHYGDFLRSSYYHEFVLPIRAFDGVGLAVSFGNIHAGVQIHRDTKRGGRFGGREVALLQLILPAFQIGIEIAMSYFATIGPQMKVLSQLSSTNGASASHVASGLTRHFRALTARELEVVRLLAARRSNYEIAEALHVSRATAKRHTENILQKLGLHSRREVERVVDGH